MVEGEINQSFARECLLFNIRDVIIESHHILSNDYVKNVVIFICNHLIIVLITYLNLYLYACDRKRSFVCPSQVYIFYLIFSWACF